MNETLGNEVALLRARVGELESALAHRRQCQEILERIVDLLRQDLAEARAKVIEDVIRWFMEHIAGTITSKAAFCDEIRRALTAAAPCSATVPVSTTNEAVPLEARPVEPAPELRCPRCQAKGLLEVPLVGNRRFDLCPSCGGTGKVRG